MHIESYNQVKHVSTSKVSYFNIIALITEPDSAVSAFEASSATLLKVYGSVPSLES